VGGGGRLMVDMITLVAFLSSYKSWVMVYICLLCD
jgi:hypothetical protein